MDREVWRWVVGYEGLYMVSNLGNVKRVGRAKGAKRDRVLKASSSSNGYLQVVLSKNHIRKIFRVHRLVAKAFLEQVDGKTFVNHIDGDKRNNNVDNLEWCTKSENALHSYHVLGQRKMKAAPDSRRRKLTNEQIIGIHKSNGSYAQIARDYGVSDVMVRNIKLGKCWSDVTCQSIA